METNKLNCPPSTLFQSTFSAILVLLSCSLAHGDNATWTGAVNSDWGNAGNWENGIIPVDQDHVCLPSGTVTFSSSSISPNLRTLQQSGGTLNITGGNLTVAQLASAVTMFDGQVNQTGGLATINAIQIGSQQGTNSSYVLNAGELRIARARDDISLHLGSNRLNSNAGTGNLTIAGGTFSTRYGVELGDSEDAGIGSFTVLGSQASLISVGGANDDFDGIWNQYSGSSLIVRFDNGGSTPIIIKDNASDIGTSAVFASGTILDVGHLSGDAGGTWTVMEVENGDITDNGLAFAAGVDTSIWSFEVDNSGTNGRLLVTAVGDPAGLPLVIGNTRQQKMRYGMDYERLWFWTGGLNAAERDSVAKWSAIDTRIDFVRVAINSGYELEEGTFNLSAYTNKIIPLMQEMQEANPDIKFYASPRPLDEATDNVAWQPYPQWITGSSGSNSNFDFDWRKCAEYLERYILLMKSHGFKISFMDLTNEWQSNDGGSRITQADYRDITEYLKSNLDAADMPQIIGPSSWNYSQGRNWIDNLDTTRRRNSVNIAASHNTDRSGTSQQFADAVRDTLGANTEIWNTEIHGWKSTSSANETTTFYYYLNQIRAGFSGINGWLAIGTTNQGHSYILNPSGTPRRNVKYFIFKKLSATSNYGYALNIIQEPAALNLDPGVSDDDPDENPTLTAALIKGNLMTVWVINHSTSNVPLNITPSGRTISESTVKRTRWTDPDDVEGFASFEQVFEGEYVNSTIPGESVCCFEILLDPEEEAYTVIQAENDDERMGPREETSGDVGGTQNLGFINDSTWARYNEISLIENSAMRFRVARPTGRPDGWVEVYLGASGQSTESILAGKPVGKVEVPVTGNWQVYETIEAVTEAPAGTFDVVLKFDEVGSDNGSPLFNFNLFETESPEPEFALGDVNRDERVNFQDIAPFIAVLSSGDYQYEADTNQDGGMNFLDISSFIFLLSN